MGKKSLWSLEKNEKKERRIGSEKGKGKKKKRRLLRRVLWIDLLNNEGGERNAHNDEI